MQAPTANRPGPVPGSDHPASFASQQPPDYPADALAAGQSGTVVLLVTVGADGSPIRVVVEKSSHVRSLDRAAVEAAKTWRFRPAVRRGQYADAVVRVPVTFNLDTQPEASGIDEVVLSRNGVRPSADAPRRLAFARGESVHVLMTHHLPAGSRVDLVWRWLGDGQVASPLVLHRQSVVVGASNLRSVDVSFKPPQGWRPGHYGLLLRLDDKPVGVLGFDVR